MKAGYGVWGMATTKCLLLTLSLTDRQWNFCLVSKCIRQCLKSVIHDVVCVCFFSYVSSSHRIIIAINQSSYQLANSGHSKWGHACSCCCMCHPLTFHPFFTLACPRTAAPPAHCLGLFLRLEASRCPSSSSLSSTPINQFDLFTFADRTFFFVYFDCCHCRRCVLPHRLLLLLCLHARACNSLGSSMHRSMPRGHNQAPQFQCHSDRVSTWAGTVSLERLIQFSMRLQQQQQRQLQQQHHMANIRFVTFDFILRLTVFAKANNCLELFENL